MQICDCFVRLGGSLNHEVQKNGVSVAEIAVLRAIHGSDAVVKVTPTKMDKRSHREELDLLLKRYRSKEKLVLALFPGHSPRLPVSLEDVGIERPKAEGAKGGKGKRAKAADADGEGDGDGEGEGGKEAA